jgi:hypothetical protein
LPPLAWSREFDTGEVFDGCGGKRECSPFMLEFAGTPKLA